MGKMKERLIEDMMRNPELYDGSMDYEFWIESRKKLNNNNKRRSNVRRKKSS